MGTTIFDQLNQLTENTLPAILVVEGEDDDLVVAAKEALFSLVKFDSSNLSQAYFDLDATNSDLALDELESLPFFDDSRLVFLEGLSNLTSARKSVFTDQQMARFSNYVEAPSETTRLVIICHGKLDNRLKLVKKLKKEAMILEAKPLDSRDLMRIFAGELEPKLLQKIFEKSNFSYPIIKQNLELLKTYAAGREITEADIEKVVPKSLQDQIFDLSDLIIAKRINAARDLVSDLELLGEDVIKILAILTSAYRLYYQVKLMQEQGISEPSQAKKIGVHPYRVKLANQKVRRLDKSALAAALSNLIHLDYQIKKGGADKNYLFDLTMIRLGQS